MAARGGQEKGRGQEDGGRETDGGWETDGGTVRARDERAGLEEVHRGATDQEHYQNMLRRVQYTSDDA